MGWKVDADIEKLKEGAKNLDRILIDLDTQNTNMETVLHSMSDVWEGDAALAFIDILKKDYDNALSSRKIIETFKTAIETHCSELEEKDNFFEKLFYQLSIWNY